MELVDGPIRAGPEYRDLVVDTSFRRVRLAKLDEDGPYRWIHERILAAARVANEHFGFRLRPRLPEPVQLLRYGPGGHYKAHTDSNKGVIAGRRLSVIIQLSDPETYRGGQVEFPDDGCRAAIELGSATFFPSHLVHVVRPLEAGIRCSLVAWAWDEGS